MAQTKIEWTQSVWNPVSGCTRVSAGCDHCYAVKMSHRLERMGQAKYTGLTVLNGRGERHFNGQVRTHEDALGIPLKWREPKRVFVNSMSDLFHKEVPFDFVDKVFAVMALCPQHTFQVLTKRPERMAEYTCGGQQRGRAVLDVAREMSRGGGVDLMNDAAVQCWPIPNVWLGTSVEDQDAADERIPHLLRCPAAVRFLSMEPLLGAVDLTHVTDGPDNGTGWVYRHRNALTNETWCDCNDWIVPINTNPVDWVIVGGESGPGARPMHPNWARSVRDQCHAAGVPFFFKQWGEWVGGIDFLSDTDDDIGPRGIYGELQNGSVVRQAALSAEVWKNWAEDDEEEGINDPISVRVGKTNAGRVLDGRTWDEMPAGSATALQASPGAASQLGEGVARG